ncbi:ATP-dependent RNA helicase Prp22 [Schizosaccharomyces cryophilus OY26]|uniref:RNA helicase n=1 Tax=Schizosaccharomyces cryophilus (strain OY26 / ATCC MYA-4695 / CBS 11777 / NBRC 106824 / NRRL Y48691) TaxID=653667 RepID=S9VSK4_SCHCR|nr:ATP-dependent RNA helicase Prp22 [Schizosaccharomyces cryophilus OY26]EPY50858.1 ATP-dependent RNA helicase Prp22 [Schizosaccharomyces cryophilus OY26]
MDDLEELEYLSLVSKVASEIKNHTGIDDKTLSEFVINLYEHSKTYDEFKENVLASGGEFAESFLQNIARLIRELHPKLKAKAQDDIVDQNKITEPNLTSKRDDVGRKRELFPGLSIPDHSNLEKSNEDSDLMNDTMNELNQLASSSRSRRLDNSRNSSYRERSRSPPPSYRGRDRSPTDRYIPNRPRDGGSASRRRKTNAYSGFPKLHEIYPGIVSSIKDFGAFVTLDGFSQRTDGLVHVSNLMGGRRVEHPSDVVSYGQPVLVKVTRVDEASKRIGLSMKEVDQVTGEDLKPKTDDNAVYRGTGANSVGLNGDGDQKNGQGSDFFDPGRNNGRKRLTSPEIWELQQLAASGTISLSSIPGFQEDFTTFNNPELKPEDDEDVEIELRDEEPRFLAGQTKLSLKLSPIKVLKAPDGSLSRAAMQGQVLASDRREMRQKETRLQSEKELEKQDLSLVWNDTMARPEDKKFAQDIRNTAAKQMTTQAPSWRQSAKGPDISYGKKTSLSMKEQRENLPVFKLRKAFLEAVFKNQVLVLLGETGSGKTTQISQYLAEEGYTDNRKIVGCTQPRRVAAMSVAKRVAEEVGCRVGEEVGYTIRFEDKTSRMTQIKYMTDGMLQRECLVDPLLKKYSVIILDEAHERTVATDVLFGLLKHTVTKRPDLKLIVTSATLDAERFSSYFHKCPIFTIPGRSYPVEILYAKQPESDYLDAALLTVMQIHLTEGPGDILVFLTGQEEIDTSCEILHERTKMLGDSVPELVILPVYSALPSETQSRIFEPAPPGGRKVVIATNIAETSLTIDGIYYVVDPGFVKQSCFDPKLGMDSLVVTPISQAQARQRSGRAGRTGPGKCYRLYTENAFQNEMLPSPVPEIQRQNLSYTILMLKAMGINDLLNFDFMDPPPAQTMVAALQNLYALSALDDEGLLTPLGRKMADFPMEPQLSKVLITSVELGCSEELLTIIAMLSVPNIWSRPREKQQEADKHRAQFSNPESDHLTLLNVYTAWKTNRCSDNWCYEHYIQARGLRRVEDVRKQILRLMDRYRQPVISCGRNRELILRALCSGHFTNVAKRDSHEGCYRTTVENAQVYMHPSSVLFGKPAEWVIYHELIQTTKEYMHTVSTIHPRWLVEVAPTFFKFANPNQISKSKKGQKVVPLFNRFEKADEWRLSKQKRGR